MEAMLPPPSKNGRKEVHPASGDLGRDPVRGPDGLRVAARFEDGADRAQEQSVPQMRPPRSA